MSCKSADIKTTEDLYNFAQKNGLQPTKDLLLRYVEEGQPEGFCPRASTRFMCRVASEGVEGVPLGHYSSNIESKHGLSIYFYMWGGGDL